MSFKDFKSLKANANIGSRTMVRAGDAVRNRGRSSIPFSTIMSAALEGARRLNRGGARQPPSEPLSGVTTTQYDFNPSRTRTRTKKRPSLKQKLILRRRRYRKRKFARKIRKIVSNDVSNISFVHGAGRSWVSSGQANALILFVGFRGPSTDTASTIPSGPASTDNYTFRLDHFTIFKQNFDDMWTYFTNRAGANPTAATSISRKWWLKLRTATLDCSITNTGWSADNNSDATAEYEVYFCWAKSKLPMDLTRPCNTINQLDAIASADTTLPGDTSAMDVTWGRYPVGTSNDLNWIPYGVENAKKYWGTKLLGRGQLTPGGTVRFNKLVKFGKSGFMNQIKWDKLSTTNTTTKGLFGPARWLLVQWRGLPNTVAATGGYRRARLVFNCQWRWTLTGSGLHSAPYAAAITPSSYV